MSRQDVAQLLRERRPRQHFADAGLPRGVDDVGLDMRGVADRRDGRQRRIGMHRRHDRQRIEPLVVQVEQHQRRRVLAHRLERAVERARKAEIDAELVRGGLDLRAEHQVVEYG